MKKKILYLFSLLIIGLLASACAPYPDDPYVIATNAALGTAAPPQHQTAVAAVFGITPTPLEDDRSVDMYATYVYDQMAMDATADAQELVRLQQEAAMTSTAISIASTATHKAEIAVQATQGAREAATARAGEQFATATQQAAFVQGTATQQQMWVQGTATERSWQITATVDAQLLAMQLENAKTQQAADTIRLEGESRQIELAVERQQIKNKADAILPWSLVIVALIIAGTWLYTSSKFREATRNPDGTFNLPMLQDKHGNWKLIKPELLPAAVSSIDVVDGTVSYLLPENEAEQTEITRRAQGVEALRVLPPGREKQALQIANTVFGDPNANAMPTVEILPPESTTRIGSVLDELEGQVLDND
jgi:hypothetical protein